MSKQFVKAKPLNEPKDKPPFPKETRKNHNKKYEEKTYLPKDSRDHIKQLLNAFKQVKKPNATVLDLQAKFPKFFGENSRKPEPEKEQSFNDILWTGPKKDLQAFQSKYATKQMSSDSSDPNWDSDQDKEVTLVSKKIDDKIIQKVTTNLSKMPPKKMTDLQRHERQFLEDYYKNARHPTSSAQQNTIHQRENSEKQDKNVEKLLSEQPTTAKYQETSQQQGQKNAPAPTINWQEYTPKVNALIDAGFIQKIQANEGEEQDLFSMEEDFSFEEEGEKNNKEESSSSSSSDDDDDDDMLTDDGPRTTVIKKKEEAGGSQGSVKGAEEPGKKFVVKISSHMFTQITEQVSINPLACTWVISDKSVRYKVSTQYMDQIYVSQSLYKLFPYISLNHSEFVHYDEIQTEKALQKFKRFNQRKRVFQNNGQQSQYNRLNKKTHQHHSNSNSQNKNSHGNSNNKKAVQYKPRQ